MSLRAVNQNLLPILLALLREQSVTRAAHKLSLSQPAVSKALIQLRSALGDQLLIRSGNSSVLTKRAEELLGPVAAVCEDLERIWHTATFDPATATREFIIAGADYCAMMIVPALAQTLAASAPGVSMRFVDYVPEVLLDSSENVDFAMTTSYSVPDVLVKANCVLPLFIDEFVAVGPQHHPLAKAGAISPDRMTATPSIVFDNDKYFVPAGFRDTLPLHMPGSSPLAVVQQFLTQPILALLTNATAVVPRRLVELISPGFPLHVLDGAVPSLRVEMVLAWSTRRDRDADHIWFRELIACHLRDDRFREPLGAVPLETGSNGATTI